MESTLIPGTDCRALAWTYLCPGDATFAFGEVDSSELCQALETCGVRSGGGPRVLVAHGSVPDLPSASDAPFGFVAINSKRVPASFAGPEYPYTRRFAVLPKLEDPRLFIPLDSPELSSSAFRIYAPYHLVARLKHLAARVLSRTRVPFWYHDHIFLAMRERPPLEEVLATLVPGDFCLALSTGTPGPTRKCTVVVLDPKGTPHAVAKISASAVSENLMRREVEVLRAVAPLIGQKTMVPDVLFDGTVEGQFLTVQGAIPGSPAPRTFTRAHEHLLSILASGEAKVATETRLFRGVDRRVRDLEAPQRGLTDAWERAKSLLDGCVVPATIVHGDFTPWNLRLHRGELLAFDWEYGQVDGLPLYDEIHHLLHVGFFLDRWSVGTARDRLAAMTATSSRWSPAQVHALQLAYLLDSLLRRREYGVPATDVLVLRYEQLIEMVSAASREMTGQ